MSLPWEEERIIPSIPGLQYFPDYISPKMEADLIARFKNLSWQEVKMHGVVARRRVAHFGYDYSFSSRTLNQTDPPPDYLLPLIKKVAITLSVSVSEIAEVLITHYPPGAPIGWHRDAPMFESLLGISLGSPCTMKLRREKKGGWEIHKLPLAECSAYIIQGTARWVWQHHIPAVKEERYSITFRTLKK